MGGRGNGMANPAGPGYEEKMGGSRGRGRGRGNAGMSNAPRGGHFGNGAPPSFGGSSGRTMSAGTSSDSNHAAGAPGNVDNMRNDSFNQNGNGAMRGGGGGGVGVSQGDGNNAGGDERYQGPGGGDRRGFGGERRSSDRYGDRGGNNGYGDRGRNNGYGGRDGGYNGYHGGNAGGYGDRRGGGRDRRGGFNQYREGGGGGYHRGSGGGGGYGPPRGQRGPVSVPPRAAPDINAIDHNVETKLFGGSRSKGIDFSKYAKIKGKVDAGSGAVPPPIEDFSQLNLHPVLLSNIEKCKYEQPTPIQKFAIPVLLEGYDVMGCAQTGSGKTAAFLIPSIQRLLDEEKKLPPQIPEREQYRQAQFPCLYPYILVAGPTRELVAQIHEEAQKFSYRTGFRCCVLTGGSSRFEARMDLEKGCHILSGTPGRLKDFLQNEKIAMNNIQTVILDEADRMLDMGFLPDIREIMGPDFGMPPRNRRQTLMFSATFPEEIKGAAREFLDNTDQGSKRAFALVKIGRVGSTTDLITQEFRYVEGWRTKMEQLMDDLGHVNKALVFVQTKRGVDEVWDDVNNSGTTAEYIHGYQPTQMDL